MLEEWIAFYCPFYAASAGEVFQSRGGEYSIPRQHERTRKAFNILKAKAVVFICILRTYLSYLCFSLGLDLGIREREEGRLVFCHLLVYLLW